MEQMTVKALLKYCQQEIKNGNGDKRIVVSDDNEGNGFHGLFYAFTDIKTESDKKYYNDHIYDSSEEDINKIIILG
jgi:hypothetical protein